EMDITCCYARQDKIWMTSPDGHRWEVFFKKDADHFGKSPDIPEATAHVAPPNGDNGARRGRCPGFVIHQREPPRLNHPLLLRRTVESALRSRPGPGGTPPSLPPPCLSLWLDRPSPNALAGPKAGSRGTCRRRRRKG